jgi:hypothetical protein
MTWIKAFNQKSKGLRLSYPKKQSLRIILTFALALFYSLIQLLLVGSKFGTNDDVGISQIANGGFTGKPSEHLVFVNSLLGFTLKWLYAITQSIQWYPVLIICSLVFSISIFIEVLIKRLQEFDQFARLGFLFISLLILLPAFVHRVFEINYTGTAYFCSILGFSSWILRSSDSHNDLAVGPLVSCFLGYLWRDSAFFSIFPIWVIVFIVCYRRNYQTKFSKNLFLFGLMLGFGKVIDLISKHSSSTWSNFYELNALRGKIHGNITIDSFITNRGMQFLSKISSIPEINLNFFFGWFFSYDVVGETSLRKILSVIEDNSNIGSFRLGEIALVEFQRSLLVYLAVFLFLLTVNSSFKWKFILSSSFVIGFQLIVISYLERYVRTPKYVIDGIQFGVYMAALILLLCQMRISDSNHKSLNFYTRACFGTLCLVLGFGSIRVIEGFASDFSTSRKDQLEFETNANIFRSQLHDPALAFSLPFEMSDLSPWSSFRMSTVPMITLGWTMSSPLEQSRLAFLGVNDDVNQALLDGELSILSSIGSNTPYQVQRYLMTNFDKCLEVQSKVLTGTGFILTRFTQSLNCENGLFTSSPITNEVFITEPDFSIFVTNCGKFPQNKTIELDLHSPFGGFAKPFRIEVSYIGRNSAPTNLFYTIKPGGVNHLKLDTSGCEIDIRSISKGVIPNLLDKKSTDARKLFFGISRVSIIAN